MQQLTSKQTLKRKKRRRLVDHGPAPVVTLVSFAWDPPTLLDTFCIFFPRLLYWMDDGGVFLIKTIIINI